MGGTAKTKAEERYAAIQRKDRGLLQTIQTASQVRLEKSAKLRQLRLAKEAQDAAEELALQELRAKAAGAPKKARAGAVNKSS